MAEKNWYDGRNKIRSFAFLSIRVDKYLDTNFAKPENKMYELLLQTVQHYV